jgi:hypothetical protein
MEGNTGRKIKEKGAGVKHPRFLICKTGQKGKTGKRKKEKEKKAGKSQKAKKAK